MNKLNDRIQRTPSGGFVHKFTIVHEAMNKFFEAVAEKI
jgi:hypothetical protein